MSLRPKPVDFDATWMLLLETVKKVIVGAKVERAAWNDRFSDVYALCVCYPEPLGDKLYAATKELLEGHVTQRYELIKSAGDDSLLKTYHDCWEEYSHGCHYLDQLYGYLNTQFIKKQRISDADMNYGGVIFEQNEQLYEIGELGLDIWKRLLVEPLKDNLVALLLKQLQLDRSGGTVNQVVLHGVVMSFVYLEKYKVKNAIQYYEGTFEALYLKQTGDHYRQESQKLFDQMSCSEYMEKAIQRMDDENMRSRKFLNATSYAKVTQELQRRLVADHLQSLHDECRELVQREKRTDLAHMYTLLSPIHNGLAVLIQETEAHVKQTSLDAVSNLQGDTMATQFVESMLEVHGKFGELIRAVFSSDQQFLSALDKACSAAINYRTNAKAACRAPELLSRYCDGLLRKSVKGMSETEADDKLSASIIIFKYLDDKDIFNRFYSKMLARRLIFGASHSMDAEEAMINRLKQACGYEFTNKLHRMFTDMTISNDLQSKFTAYLRDLPTPTDLGVNFSILVLQAGAWPVDSNNVPPFALPQELERSVQTFETFYHSNFNGRKLTWIYTFCTAEVKLTYLRRPYYVTMGPYLMAILLQFNSVAPLGDSSPPSLTLKDLQDATQLQEKEMIRNVNILLESKLVTADSTELTESTVLSLNLSYNSKRSKFKMIGQMKDTVQQEAEQTHKAVDEDRKLFLQAAIVRIMKSRKTLKHTQLIQEVLSQSQARFAPSIPMIKKCIELLIERAYIGRTENTTDQYFYIA